MSLNVTNYIDCTNKNESVESLFKQLIVTDSLGNLYLRTYAAGAGESVVGTFVDADLTTYDGHTGLEVVHNLGVSSGIGLIVYDNIGQFVTGITLVVIDENTVFIQIDDTITGTWSYKLFT